MSDDEPDQPAEDLGTQEPEPQPEPAYPALELDQMRESDQSGGAGWRSLDDA
jgi:hypothetical protein